MYSKHTYAHTATYMHCTQTLIQDMYGTTVYPQHLLCSRTNVLSELLHHQWIKIHHKYLYTNDTHTYIYIHNTCIVKWTANIYEYKLTFGAQNKYLSLAMQPLDSHIKNVQ